MGWDWIGEIESVEFVLPGPNSRQAGNFPRKD
jgi:hypothetical protein